MRKGNLIAVAASGLVVALPLLFGVRAWRDRELNRHAALLRADPELVRQVRAAWPGKVLPGEASWSAAEPEPRPEDLRALEVLRPLGKDAARPLLKVLVQTYGDERKQGSASYWNYRDEQVTYPCFVHLAELADPSLNDVLLELVGDSKVHAELAVGAVIALAWPGNRPGFDRLCNLALDRGRQNSLREEILYRLPRFRLPPPAALGDLLYESFGSIDLRAAASLARMGVLEAPGFIRDSKFYDFGDSSSEHLKDAAKAVAGGPREAPEDGAESWTGEQAKAVFVAWLDRHPEAVDTEFERIRAAYLASPRREREIEIQSFEDIAGAAEDRLDFASAALLLSRAKDREKYLERLDRLALLVKKRIAGLRDPAAIIQRLNETLLKIGCRSRPAQTHTDGYHLQFVLNADAGTCLGYTSLYIAIAERLGLPLHPVFVPFHVFVRWDDGTHRQNIEVTGDGEPLPDADYATGKFSEQRIPTALVEKGLFLRNATRRELLGALLSNLAAGRSESEDWVDAGELAGQALRLKPDDATARLVLATALFNTRFDAGEEVLKEIDAGLEFYPGSRTLLTSRMEVLAALGRRDEALAAGLAAAGGPERNLRADAVRVVCLSRLARHEEAEHLFRELDRDQSDLSPAWRRAIRCQLLLRRDPERAAEVRSADETEAFAILPAAARALLDPALGESPRPAAALPFLRELGARLGALPPADGIFHFSPGTSPQLLDRAMALRSLDRPNLTRDHAVLRARAHLLLGERAEAERWLREAEATGRSNRDLLVLQRDLAAGKGR